MTELTYTTNEAFATMRLKNNGSTFEELFKFYKNDDVTDWKYMCRLIKGVPQVNNIIGVADNLRQLKREVKKWFDKL